jgi:WD40 repeat protein
VDPPSVAFSPNGERVTAGCQSGELLTWDIQTGTLHRIDSPRGNILSIAYSPDGKLFAIGHTWGNVYLLDLITNKWRLFRAGGEKGGPHVEGLAFSPDSEWLAVADLAGIFLFNLSTGEKRTPPSKDIELGISVKFSPTWNALLFESGTPGFSHAFYLWELANDKLQKGGGFGRQGGAVAFSPNGRAVASGWNHPNERNIKIFNLGGTNQDLPKCECQFNDLDYSPNGKFIVSASGESIRLWNVRTGEMRILGWDLATIVKIKFSPDGRHIVSSNDKTGEIRLWDMPRDVYAN